LTPFCAADFDKYDQDFDNHKGLTFTVPVTEVANDSMHALHVMTSIYLKTE